MAKFAKTGCTDTCGNNVTIPFPFGIGAGCSVNLWYVVECKFNKPYLSALNNLEFLGVDLENQTVTLSTRRISDCQKPVWNSYDVMGVDLGESPFFFSKSHNKFVFVGCGNAAIMNNGSVVTGCSTSCRNVTFTGSDRNNCYGIHCCQTAIPQYLSSYNINITGLGEEDGGCLSAYLMDKALYEEGKFSVTNTSSIPISLLWTLSKSDQIDCCDVYTPYKRVLDVFNGTPVDTWKCYYHKDKNPYLIDGCDDDPEIETPKYAKTDCNDTCGNVRIPYPFGIGANCSLNQWYHVDCISSIPYLRALNHLQVLMVDLKNLTVTIKVSSPRIIDCQTPVWNSSEIMGMELGMSPFLFSRPHNKFVFEGCGTVMMMDNGSVLTGCSTTCSSLTHSDSNNCYGIGCCETAFPHYFNSFNINLIGLGEEEGSCGTAFLVDEASYEEGRFSDPFIVKNNTPFVPVSLMWTVADMDQITCCYGNSPTRRKVDMFNGTTVDTWTCYSPSYYEGNPYLINGCKYIEGV
ncbi:hypothetical protein QVD17_37373 [Tagetes erecta]|uniref:Wall-associated receptor kinase galacturonan-binding domain-containing protein n=1 Tax=Tagetes erecta TaxID=13708 RepID=A0AAD8JY45_TARER|nr:hypothetical protein QVD17_37373 [Tagetes erecta]